MKNQINTSEGNVQLIGTDGKMINVHPSHVYAVFNVDTVSFLLIAMPKSSGLAVFTSTAEDLLVNGQSYSFEELKTVIPEEFAEAGAQARCEIVDELPATGKTNTIYLVPKPSGQTGYDEYIYIKDQQKWELVGDTSIEMENYLLKTDFYTYSAATEVTINTLSGAISDEASRAISAESALNLYIDEVSGITDTLDGDIDILEGSLAQEASARANADTALSGAISSVTEDVAALSGDVTAHTSNTDIHVTAADKTAWADKYTKAEVDGIVSGLNDSIDAVSGAVADETARAISAETALHDEIENIDLSDYYTKSQTSGATELSTAFAAKQNVLTAGENIVISGDVISAEAGNDVTELTQAEYDALVEAGTVDPNSFYIITDAPAVTVVQTTGTSSGSVMSQSAVTTSLNNCVTLDTAQTISGIKVFTYSSSGKKAIEFKQTDDSSKVGFTVRNSASTNNEIASFEFRPNTFTIDGVQHPLMYFGHYRNSNTAAAGVPQTVIGFRQYDQANAAAYHFVMPLPEKAKTPFSLTTSFKDFYAPLGFKNGSTIIKADETGLVDLSSEFSGLTTTGDTNALSGTVTAHTANTDVHVTTGDKATWNAKLDSSAISDMATQTWVGQQGYLTQHQDISGKQDVSGMTAYTTTATTDALNTVVTAHTANTDVHVTAQDKTTWNAKLDSSAISDMATQTWVGQQGYLTQHQDISGKQDVSGMTAYTTTATTDALNTVVTAHTADTTVHVTSADKTAWNGAVTASTANTTALGGLSLVKLSQAEYDALVTKDSNTLYVIND